MKTSILALVAALVVSVNAFAAAKDLKTLNGLLALGAQSEEFMSQVHVGLDDIACSYSNISHQFRCDMNDIAAHEGQGAILTLTGRKAEVMFGILDDAGAPSANGMGKIYVGAQSIRCAQSAEGVADGTPAERTYCEILLGQP